MRSRFLGSANWLFSTQTLLSLIQFIFGVLLARLIVPTAFGEFAFYLAIIEGLSLLTGFGINTSILQDTRSDPSSFRTTGFYLAATLVLGYFLIAYSVGLLLISQNFHVYVAMLVAKTGFMLSGVHGILLQREYKFRAYGTIQLISFLAGSITGLGLAVLGYELEALATQYVLAQCILSGLTLAASPFEVSLRERPTRQNLSELLKNGRDLFPSQMAEKLITSLDKIAIRESVGFEGLAFYERAIRLGQRLQAMFIGVFQPLVSVSFAELQTDKARLSLFYSSSVWVVMRVSLVIVLVMVYVSDYLIEFLYGPSWGAAASLVPLVSAYVLLAPIRKISRSLLLSTGFFRQLRNIQVFEVIVLLVMLAVAISIGRLEIFCIGISGWAVVSNAAYVGYIRRIIRVEVAVLYALPLTVFLVLVAISESVRSAFAAAIPSDLLVVIASTSFVIAVIAAMVSAFERKMLFKFINLLR